MVVIEAKNVKKTVPFGTQSISILEGINLVVKQSETISILGVSGSGKSTLLSLLAGLDSATAGQIILLGNSLEDCDENKRSSIRQGSIGFIFQNFYLLPQFTAIENVALACDIAGIEGGSEAARDILSKVNLEHRLDHYPQLLSGGEQQRVALARAFVTKPKIIFADEPTGALDEKTGLAVVDLLYSLNEIYKTTLVMVTHDKTVSAKSEKVYTLHDGFLRQEA